MARFNEILPTELIKQFETLEVNTEKMLGEMVQAGADIAEKNIIAKTKLVLESLIIEHKVKENVKIGVKEFAFNSAKLSLGKFINDEFGSHTRYTYNACKTVVVMKIDGKILVINDKNDDVTREIYLKISSEMSE